MKRLNVKLALWLVGIAVFSVVGVHFLHGYQVDRNADFLKVQAEQAQTAGNDEEAVKYYSQYLRHRDDRDAYEALAQLTVKVAQNPKATWTDFVKAFNVLEEAIRRYPDLNDVRISLIDYTIAIGRIPDAQDHIRILKEQGSTDTRIPLKEAVCFMRTGEPEKARYELYKMVGYDPETKQFSAEPPSTATEVDAFSLLAGILQGKDGDSALADALMEKLVEWNPDSAKAHLARANYLSQLWQNAREDTPEGKDLKTNLFAEVQKELEKTKSIDPDNVDAKLLSATTAMIEQNFETSQELLDQALQLEPTRADVYLRRAVLAQAQKQPEKAAEELRAGIKVASNLRPLLEALVELQLQLSDLNAAAETCEQMSKVQSIPQETVGFHRARILLGQGKTLEATREFERVRPAYERQGTLQARAVNLLLGRCYARLAMSDRQLEVYRRILTTAPGLLEARMGEVSALQALGRFDEAEATVNLLANAAPNAGPLQGDILQIVVRQESSKPVEERNWERTQALAKLIGSNESRTDLQNQLLQVDLLLAQGKTDEALGILGTLRRENPKDVSIWLRLSRLMSSEEKYQDRVPQLLNLAEKEVGKSAALTSERIRLITRTGGENVIPELQKIEAAIQEYEPLEQQAILGQLGTAYLTAGDYDNGKRCIKQVMVAEPSNVRVRQVLLDLALDRGDDAMVNEITEELRKSPLFGPQSTMYRYAQAAHQVKELFRKKSKKQSPLTEAERRVLSEARKLVDEAIALRAEWAPLWRLRADISQLEGDVSGAISDLQQSLAYAQSGQEISARKLVTLLYGTGRFTEANDAMKYLGDSQLDESMRRIKEATVFKSGNPKQAIEMVRKDIEQNPEDPSNYLWLGELLENVGDGKGAEDAFRTAAEKGPKLARAWEFLVRRLMANEKADEAMAATEQALKNLDDDPLSIARLYQRIGKAEEAEKYYGQAAAQKPDDLLVKRHIAEFYLQQKDLAKSQKQLDQIIDAASKSSDPTAKAHLAWARTQKAQTMAPDRDYAGIMEAVKLIEQNAQDGELSRPDIMAVLSLLSTRLEESSSRQKAIKLFEKLQAVEPLDPQQAVTLAQLYNREGDWQSGRTLMSRAVTNFEGSPEMMMIFAEMLFEHDEVDVARQYVDRANSMLQSTLTPAASPSARGVRILQARLLHHDDKKAEAAKVLEGWLPRPLPQQQLPLLLDVAGQMESLELYDDAERLFREYLTQVPGGGKVALAGFLGRRGDIEQSFTMLNEAQTEVPPLEVLRTGLANLRNYPDKVTDAHKLLLASWSKATVAESQDDDRTNLAVAEMYDLLGRYDEVEKIYRKVLADPKLTSMTRAIIANNLAFILAGTNPTAARGVEALTLINQAIAVLGPMSDLLDTRGLANMAQGKYDEAATDIRAAAADRPTTSKYYHLAQVEKQLGNAEAAHQAITKAQELQGEHNTLTPFERKGYEQLKKELN